MTEKRKLPEYFFLTKKEEEAMNVLWASDTPLSASEIAEGIPNRKWPAASIQSILRTLEKKQAVKVAEITKIGKSYGRLFQPTLSINEYAAMQFKRYYKIDKKNDLSIMSSLIGHNRSPEEIVEILRELLDEYEEE
ncbi:BlaI/MecI/CopY family transcriptional regulator [Clostridium sp. Marseille-P2415]|uniref:BlaI/MecI/CopY family transcriptional regulator n=1 Tax=Clostridium sp. Marseille-P2415 TaxID=1805471 RepID=UPI0009888208|nr:BlaI/MecI/CopY family transcriptional regulator [Clostridium sp. Marseille-P2415]